MTCDCDCPTCTAYVMAVNNEMNRLRQAVDAVASSLERKQQQFDAWVEEGPGIKAAAIRMFGRLYL